MASAAGDILKANEAEILAGWLAELQATGWGDNGRFSDGDWQGQAKEMFKLVAACGGAGGDLDSAAAAPLREFLQNLSRTMAQYQEIVRWSRQPHTATIRMTRGNIELALLAQDAPMTAWNFAQLAQKKYFDNSSFMRVVPNFVIQGGDPRNDMNGGPGYSIRDEINLQKYTRGAVGMALSGPDTGGSQFFLTFLPTPHLNGKHTCFGRIIEGLDVLARLQRIDPGMPSGKTPDKIVTAEVGRTRDHAYVPKKVE